MTGNLPQCEADEILLRNPVTRPKSSAANSKFASQGYRLGTRAENERRNQTEDEVKILQTAQAFGNVTVPSTSRVIRPEVEVVSESVRQPRERIIPIKLLDRNEREVHWVDDDDNDENAQLQKALAMSLQNYELEEKNRDLKLRLETTPTTETGFNLMNPPVVKATATTDEEEDDELKRALQLSLECVTAPQTPDREEIRWHRLNHLNMISRNSQPETSTKLNT